MTTRHAGVARLGPRSAQPDSGTPRSARPALIAQVLELLARHEGRPLRLLDLCRLTGGSERTLRIAFRETFGIGPGRYLRLRRLHLIRAALAISDPRHATVASIAARFGCSDCGRMAADYHALFGEYPSATLLRRLNQ